MTGARHERQRTAAAGAKESAEPIQHFTVASRLPFRLVSRSPSQRRSRVRQPLYDTDISWRRARCSTPLLGEEKNIVFSRRQDYCRRPLPIPWRGDQRGETALTKSSDEEVHLNRTCAHAVTGERREGPAGRARPREVLRLWSWLPLLELDVSFYERLHEKRSGVCAGWSSRSGWEPRH